MARGVGVFLAMDDRDKDLVAKRLSPSIHKYDSVFIYSGLSAE